MVSGNTPNTHIDIVPTAPKPVLTVMQPATVSSLLDTLNLIDQMSERVSEDKSGDTGGSGGTKQGSGASGATKVLSPRDQAIASLPDQPVMQQKLQQKIHIEVRQLRKQIRSIPGGSKPGSAYKLNKLYARIRMLNRLLASLLDASVDMIRRLFIRVFIDEQPTL